MTWTAFIDGGARGNPGPAGVGVAILDDSSKVVFAAGFFLGRLTSNQAEYQGMLKALDYLARAKAGEITIVSDSELLVRQITGQYRVKAPGLKPLFDQARQKLLQFDCWQIRHVTRDQNTHADELANRAMDAKRDVVTVDELGLAEKTSEKCHNSVTDTLFSQNADALPAVRKTVGPPAVEVRVVKPPKACPACLPRRPFIFSTVAPANFCVHACAAVIEAVLTLQDADHDSQDATITATCPKTDCKAVFEIKRL